MSFQILPADTPIKITDLAEELEIKPEILLALIRDKKMATMFLNNFWSIKVKITPTDLGFNRTEFIGKETFHDEQYIQLNTSSIDTIRNNGNFKFDIYRVDDSEGFKRQFYYQDEYGNNIEKVVSTNDIYITAGNASQLRDKISGMTEEVQNNIAPKREKTLLKVIGALLSMKYTEKKYKKDNGKGNAFAIALQFNIDLGNAGLNDDGIKEDTLRKNVIQAALKAIEENRKE